MKIRQLAFAVSLGLTSSMALAFHCPKDMKAIDAALAKNPKLSDAEMKDVKAYREAGEKSHKAGKHQDSVDALAKAMKILKI